MLPTIEDDWREFEAQMRAGGMSDEKTIENCKLAFYVGAYKLHGRLVSTVAKGEEAFCELVVDTQTEFAEFKTLYRHRFSE